MAKIVKIPLVMKNGEKATDMKSLKENFDIESVVGYFLDGKLEKWLTDRYYEDEAEAVGQLNKDDPQLAGKLCKIFGIEYEEDDPIDAEEIAKRNERIARLKQLTDDDEILQNVDSVAFDQEELAELYDQGIEKIFLCEGEFKIPKSKQGVTHIPILGATVLGLPKSESEPCVESGEIKTTAETATDEIIISAHIEVDSSEHKEFKNARIIFKDTIDCNGTLSFERCDIICNLSDISNQSLRFRNGILQADEGTVLFRNCKITFAQENEELYFLHATDTTVEFDDCRFFGCKNFLYADACEDISFTSCIGKELQTPFYVGWSDCSIQLTNCTFVSSLNSIVPVEVNYGKISIDSGKALFQLARDEISITSSHFEGFLKGVFVGETDDMSVDNTTFVECIGVLTNPYNGRNSEAQFNKCRFERSFPLFHGKEISVEDCDFIDCYGAIEVVSFQCDSSRFTQGLVVIQTPHYASGRGESSFSDCTFEDIDMHKAKATLAASLKNGFKYISFSSKESAEAVFDGCGSTLIDVGNTGSMSNCQFRNIRLNDLRFLIECGRRMDIDGCIFEHCSTSESLLDKTVYTVYRGGLFDWGRKQQADYSISNCRGLKD